MELDARSRRTARDSNTPSVTPTIDYPLLAQEIFKYLRGDVTQRALSEKMGFSYNQVGKWESGATQIHWDTFLEVARLADVPVERRLRFYFSSYKGELEIHKMIEHFEKELSIGSTRDQFLKKAVKKWAANKSSPTFSEFLRLLDSRPSSLFGFLMLFVDCSKIESIEKPYSRFAASLDASLSDPYVSYVNAALQLKGYSDLEKHCDQYVATHAVCTPKRVRDILAMLLDLGLVSKANGKYIPNHFDFSFSNLRSEKLRIFNKLTAQIAADSYALVRSDVNHVDCVNSGATSVRVVAMSKEASEKVDSLLYKFHNDVAQVVNEDKAPKDNVQIIVLNHFPSNFSTKNINVDPSKF